MAHRRYLPLPAPAAKPEHLDKSHRQQQTRLKNIYEAQLIFKQKTHSLKKSKNKKHEEQPPKNKTPIQQLNLAQIKHSHRYRQAQKQPKADSFHLHISQEHQKGRNRYKQPSALTSRREEAQTDRSEMFKIRRKSISGSLKKKMKEQNAQYLSANPVLPSQLNYYQQARKLYKQNKTSQALKLFELTIEKNPDLLQAQYYLALCHLSKHNYDSAYVYLNHLLQIKYSKKTIFIFAAIAAKNIDKIDRAMTIVSLGIDKYPDYIDLYLYRAKIYEQMKEYQSAAEDYQFALKTRKDNAEVLMNYALCLKEIGRMSNCLSHLNSAFYCDNAQPLKPKILSQKIKINYNNKKLKECRKDIAKLQELQPQSSELHLYKGLMQMQQNNKKGALISFQRCIRINNSKQALVSALVEIAKSKIQDRDFYSALYHINRAQHLQLQSPDIQKFKLFTQGVVFLMKRKINQGVDNLNKMAQKHTLGPYFDKLFYLYRAFGYFMQNQHHLAIQDYLTAEKYSPKDKYIHYNQLIAEGIVKVNEQKYQDALDKFDQAQNVISAGNHNQNMKIEPFIYRAMTFVQKTKAGKKDQLQTLEEIFISLKQLDKAHDINDGNSNMLYLRALIYMHLGKTDDGLQDIIKAISKSQQNVAKYFFFRALAHETLSNTKQALNDFNICINLDEKHANSYLERGKLLFSNQQTAKGLEDIKKYQQIMPEADSKLHQCGLFYISKEYDLAQNCLEDIKDQQKKQRMQILINFKQLRISQAKQKMTSPTDKMICQIILGQWSTQEHPMQHLQFFTRMEYFCFMGIKYYNLNMYEQAINQFSLAVKEKTLMDLQENYQVQEQDQDIEELLDVPVESETKANELHFLNYNLFLAYLANNQKKRAYEIFIRDLLPAKEHFLKSQAIGTLSRLLFQSMKSKQAVAFPEKSEASPNPNQQQYQQKQVFEFYLFRSMLGQASDNIDIILPNFVMRTRLCYPMPFARDIYEQYSPKINSKFMLQCIKISQVENRPEPPWVKRNNLDLIFTDQVININIEFQTTQHDEQNQDDQDYEGDEEGEEGDEESSARDAPESREEMFDPRRFREQMRLDDDIQRKLKKIMGGEKEEQ